MVKVFNKYIEDTKEFKKELKDIGLTSLDDLRTAIKTNPYAKDIQF